MKTSVTLKKPLDFSFLKPKKLNFSNYKGSIFTLISIIVFIGVWHMGATWLYTIEANRKIEKALTEQGATAAAEMESCIASGNVKCQPNTLPTPAQVLNGVNALWSDHQIISAKKSAFIKKTAKVNAGRVAKGLAAIKYTGRPSFIDQVGTSIKTVLTGVLLAMLLAIPMGIVLGLSASLRASLNWIIQIFKPVSPVVWLLLVFMIVKTAIRNEDLDKSFIISFISVGLCSMWATLMNTAMGVSNVEKDYLNVASVLQLSTFKKVFKVILPASLPMIFTGLRITVSVAWMVLIAIELLAQSPGLGSFVWEEFQNGANDSNAKIIVAMFVIGFIGFGLDRIMMYLQKAMSFK